MGSELVTGNGDNVLAWIGWAVGEHSYSLVLDGARLGDEGTHFRRRSDDHHATVLCREDARVSPRRRPWGSADAKRKRLGGTDLGCAASFFKQKKRRWYKGRAILSCYEKKNVSNVLRKDDMDPPTHTKSEQPLKNSSRMEPTRRRFLHHALTGPPDHDSGVQSLRITTLHFVVLERNVVDPLASY